jgi:hypothetical protein
MFEPNIDLASIRTKALPPRHVALHGEVMRAIFDVLRGTGETLTTNDLTMRIMASRRLNTVDAPLVRTMQKRVGAAMRQLREKVGQPQLGHTALPPGSTHRMPANSASASQSAMCATFATLSVRALAERRKC